MNSARRYIETKNKDGSTGKRLSREKRAVTDPLFVDLATFAALFSVSENVAKSWERRGWITSVTLLTEAESQRPPKRFFMQDVRALALKFRSGAITITNEEPGRGKGGHGLDMPRTREVRSNGFTVSQKRATADTERRTARAADCGDRTARAAV